MVGEPIWTPRHWPESRLTGVTLLAAALIMAVPLWSVWAPSMPDYPAHLASFALIEQVSFHHGASGAANSNIYHLQWAFVPNLASEVLVPLLARLTGLVAATKLFLTAAIFLWVLGPGAVLAQPMFVGLDDAIGPRGMRLAVGSDGSSGGDGGGGCLGGCGGGCGG